MYGFSQDEQLLLFMDGFGLTRLSRPKQIKTDSKISGSESAGAVSVSADGSLGASYEDIWDKSVLWQLPALKSSKRFERFRERGAQAHPDGAHYLTNNYGKLTIKPASKAVLLPQRIDPPRPVKKVSQVEVELDLSKGGEQLDPLHWGDSKPEALAPLRVAHDGTLLLFDGGELICAQLEGGGAKVLWRRVVRAAEYTRLEFFADRDHCALFLHQGRRWKTLLRVKAGGAVQEQILELDSLAVPTLAGRFLAWQPQADLVRRRDLDSGEEQDFSVAVYDKARKFDGKNEGMGTIFAGAQGSLFFLPPHRETVVDLVKGVEISRKLPAKEQALRQAIIALVRSYSEPARLAGVTIELGRLDLNPKYKSVSVTHRIAGGDSLFGSLLASYSQSVWGNANEKLADGWRMGGYGSHGGIQQKQKLSREELIAGYSSLFDHGVGFPATVGFWGRFLDDDQNASDNATLALLAQMLITVVGEGPQAKLDLAALAKRGAPSLAEVQEAFTRYPKRVESEELSYEITRFAGHLFNRLFGAKAVELWRDLYLANRDWAQFGSAYMDFDYYAIRPLLEAHPEAAKVLRDWLAKHPDAKVPEHQRAHVKQLREQLSS